MKPTSSALSLVLPLFLVVGCASSVQNGAPSNASTPNDARAAQDAAQEQVSTSSASPSWADPSAPAPRARLSRTVTLGEGTDDLAYTAPRSAPPPGTAPGVVVNNNVTVMSQPVYGGYPGYGYGFGVPRAGSVGRDFHHRSVPARAPWAPTGWEGARRTAAPGQTPGIGGNWSPAPSYGPAQMR